MMKASARSKTSPKKLRKFIPVEEAIARWRRDPKYAREYDALAEEFALVSEIIKARAAAGLTQAELAKRMKTTQGAGRPCRRRERSSASPRRPATSSRSASNLPMLEYRLAHGGGGLLSTQATVILDAQAAL